VYKDNAILRCDAKTPLTFKGYNEFTYNTANIILSLSHYIFIEENSIVNISHNKALNDSENAALIYYKIKYMSFGPCLFQFLSPKGNLDEDFIHYNTDIFIVAFENNKDYQNIVDGSKLNTCSWVNKSAFRLLSPGNVYKRVLQLDANIENVITRQHATFCFCEGEMHTDCIRDHFGPIFPGQTIPISLKQIPPTHVSDSFTAVHEIFHNF